MFRHAAIRSKEHPYSHPIQLGVFVALLIVWILDSFVYRFSTFLASEVRLPVRLGLAIPCIVAGSMLLEWSHRALFREGHGGIVNGGAYSLVRHPMYLGIMLVYLSPILATLSLSSLLLWILGFALYDRLADYEEEDLIAAFGDGYAAYRRKVPKWLPRIGREVQGQQNDHSDDK